jgi:hypothetical protein
MPFPPSPPAARPGPHRVGSAPRCRRQPACRLLPHRRQRAGGRQPGGFKVRAFDAASTKCVRLRGRQGQVIDQPRPRVRASVDSRGLTRHTVSEPSCSAATRRRPPRGANRRVWPRCSAGRVRMSNATGGQSGTREADMTTRRGRLTVLAATAAMAGGLALAGAPNASAATVSADTQAVTTISATVPSACTPRHRGSDWRWYDDHHGHHWWRHHEYDSRHHRWYWRDYRNDNRYCG